MSNRINQTFSDCQYKVPLINDLLEAIRIFLQKKRLSLFYYNQKYHLKLTQNFNFIIMSMQAGRPLEVYLNVYDLNPSSNSSLYNCGLGFYHTGIQLELKQFTFGAHAGDSTGVMEVPPKVNHPNFRESILLGTTKYSYREIYSMLDNIKEKFPGNSYHLIRKNCNTFTNCFAEALLHKPIPSWVNRMANIGKVFLEINDFLGMRAYESRYQTSAAQLGVKLQQKRDVFAKGGVMIG